MPPLKSTLKIASYVDQGCLGAILPPAWRGQLTDAAAVGWQADEVEAVFADILGHLDGQGLAAAQLERLSQAAFVPVANATHMARPPQLYSRLRTALSPFAFEVPSAFIPHIKVRRPGPGEQHQRRVRPANGHAWFRSFTKKLPSRALHFNFKCCHSGEASTTVPMKTRMIVVYSALHFSHRIRTI